MSVLPTNRPRTLGPARAGFIALLVMLGAGCSPAPPAIDPPNLVVIIGDDLGYADAGFMGNDIVRTPHLDKLAAEGTVFTQGYVTASECRPSLLSLLTGLQPYQVERYSRRLAATGRGRNDVNRILDLPTLPELLAARGYESFQVGKHWEGMAEQARFTAGTKSGGLGGGALGKSAGGFPGLEVGRTTMKPLWDLLDTAGADPFLLWFAPLLPHAPMDAPEEIRARYRGFELSPSALAYYANVSRLDDAVGALMERLESMGVLDRTLVVYVSDNGWDQAPDVTHAGGRAGKLGGTRGKMSMHDLGFRTPIVFRWPGRVPAGVVNDELVSTLDLMPTLLDYAGLRVPPGGEGRSLRARIAGAEPAEPRTLYGWMKEALPDAVGPDSIRWAPARQPAVFARTAGWHYFAFEGTRPGDSNEEHLYDLAADPSELVNVAGAHPHAVRMFRVGAARWKRAMNATLPDRDGHTHAWTAPRTAAPDARNSAAAGPRNALAPEVMQ